MSTARRTVFWTRGRGLEASRIGRARSEPSAPQLGHLNSQTPGMTGEGLNTVPARGRAEDAERGRAGQGVRTRFHAAGAVCAWC